MSPPPAGAGTWPATRFPVPAKALIPAAVAVLVAVRVAAVDPA
jgi:hypothetical protein